MALGLEKGAQETWSPELSETGGVGLKAEPSSVAELPEGSCQPTLEKDFVQQSSGCNGWWPPGRKALPSQGASGTHDLRPPALAE